MSSEKFCLRWNDFEKNISSAFRDLRGDKHFFDVTLACGNDQIQAHKVILSACSSFFHNILRRNPHQHPLLYLKGVKSCDLQSVLNFMYHGEVNIAQDDLNSFLAVAEDLEIKGLTQGNPGTNNSSGTNKNNNPGEHKSLGDHANTIPDHANTRVAPANNINAAITPSQSQPAPDLMPTAVVKAEPRDYVQPQHYQQALQQSEPGYQHSQQLAHADHQDVEYQDDEDYGQYQETMVYQDTMGVAGAVTKVFVSQDKIAEYIQEQCLYQTDSAGTKIWSCGVCQKYLNHKRDLMRHIESFHIETTPYACTHCEAQFNTKRSVQRHTLSVHNTTYSQ